jgi:hypothetical protein
MVRNVLIRRSRILYLYKNVVLLRSTNKLSINNELSRADVLEIISRSQKIFSTYLKLEIKVPHSIGYENDKLINTITTLFSDFVHGTAVSVLQGL